ncbi:MAG: FkbM family methyltransferase [Arcicella sp.]|nr:FkbM family methyltransferase [Arcicella sp.]
MIRKIKNMVWNGLNFTAIGPLLQLYMVGEIKTNGWMKSFATKKAVDRNNNPIPWWTYPMVDFLKERLNASIIIFEYGCGGSTKWLANKVGHITSLEDHKEWMEFVKSDMPNNTTLIYQPIDELESYSKAIQRDNTKYNFIIVDGKERNQCVTHCLGNLSEDGIILLDDSFRTEYTVSIELLKQKGFKKLDFWGMVPVVPAKSCTSIFYRKDNILGL